MTRLEQHTAMVRAMDPWVGTRWDAALDHAIEESGLVTAATRAAWRSNPHKGKPLTFKQVLRAATELPGRELRLQAQDHAGPTSPRSRGNGAAASAPEPSGRRSRLTSGGPAGRE